MRLKVFIFSIFALNAPVHAENITLNDHTCVSLSDARECNSSCSLLKGGWQREIRVDSLKSEVMVISKKEGRVEAISKYKGCAIVDENNWVCEPDIRGENNQLKFTNYMRNGNYFLMTQLRGSVMHFICSK